MALYQVFKNNSLIADQVSGSELSKFIPAGSRLISGNTSTVLTKPDGGLETLEEIKAVYKNRQGGTVTIIQIK